MNLLIDWLNRLAEFVSLPSAWGIFFMGSLIYLISEWRFRFLAMVTQYLFVGILFLRIFNSRPEMAMMKIIIGWLISGSLLVSAGVRRQADTDNGIGSTLRWATNLPFRLTSLATVTVIAYLASQKFPLPYVSPELGLACFLLLVLALLYFGTDEQDAGIVGIGVLNLLVALDIFYSAQEPGLLVTGLLVVLNLIVGLATSYLMVAEVPL
jgi:hypothetical protein